MSATLRDSARRYCRAIRDRVLELARIDLDGALGLAAYYGAFLHRNHVGIYADPELEQELIEAMDSRAIPGDPGQPKPGVLHLATEVYPWGGHTRVIERLVGAGLGDAVASQSAIPAPVQAALRDAARTIAPLRGPDHVETVRRIVSVGRQYSAVILHIHPFDIASAVAAGILARGGVRILLYNHADHGFGFGFSSAEKILELSKYGWEKAGQRQIDGRQAYVGIPVASSSKVKRLDGSERRIMIAGASPKFRPFENANAATFIETLIDRLDGDVQFDIVGPRGYERPFRDLGHRARRCVTYHGLLPHDRFMRLLAGCGTYVDSFPQGNGTGFVEALVSGAPCFGLDLLAGCSYADVLRSHTLEELVGRVLAFMKNPADTKNRFEEARTVVRAHQSPGVCASRIRAVLDKGLAEPLPPQLDNARCMMDFYERYWEASGTIVFATRTAASLSASLRFWLLAQASRQLGRTEIAEWGKLALICLAAAAIARK